VMRKILVLNLNTESSIQMLSISGNTIHFHCSFFADKVSFYNCCKAQFSLSGRLEKWRTLFCLQCYHLQGGVPLCSYKTKHVHKGLGTVKLFDIITTRKLTMSLLFDQIFFLQINALLGTKNLCLVS